MAKRGDVLAAKRRLGFSAPGMPEHFVIVQSDQLRDLDTVIVVPMDDDGEVYEGDPLVVRVSAKEAGTKRPQVALVHLAVSAARDKFEAATAGRLSSKSMTAIDALVRFVVDV